MILPVKNIPQASELNRVLAEGILKQCGPEALDEVTREALAAPAEEQESVLSRWLHLGKSATTPKALDEIGLLGAVIRKLRGGEPKHVLSAPVVVRAHGETVWEGAVEVFTLTGRASGGRVFAWMHRWGGRAEDTRYVTMLEVGPVDSPKKAVELYMESGGKG